MGNYSYAYMVEYLPVRYSPTREQRANRQLVYDFKDGCCSSKIVKEFTDYINGHIQGEKSEYVICFIPASTKDKTKRRYSEFAKLLQTHTGIQTSLTAICKSKDGEAGHLTVRPVDPTTDFCFSSQEFRGKKVFLIDDVITRGRTFRLTANKLICNGAKDVSGLFVAKTINPDYDEIHDETRNVSGVVIAS